MADILEYAPPSEIGGLPCVRIRFVIPDVVVTDGLDAMKDRWVRMYDELDRFVVVADLTHESLMSFNTAWVVPHVLEMLFKMRDRSEQQVVVSGLVVNYMGRKVADGVTTVYTPTRPLFYGETMEAVQRQITAHLEATE